MASDAQLISAFSSRASEIGAKITVFDWTKLWLPNATDISAGFNMNGEMFVGRGTSFGEANAIAKAITEAVERATAYSNGLSHSNGVSAHPDAAKAEANAKLELYERDAFLCHFLTRTPFFKVQVPSEIRTLFKPAFERASSCRVSS